MPLRPGDAAPDFVLKDEHGRDFRLSSLAGQRIVLYFYPRDGTPGCTLEAKGFRDHYPEIQAAGAAVVGVSMDDPARHHDFAAKCELPFPLLSDPEGRVHDLYDAWWTTLMGRRQVAVKRCTFVIDEDGIIRRVYGRVSPMGHARQVVKELERLKAQKAWGKRAQDADEKATRRVRELLRR
jgi:thioredoxin-dependent peroxiredoxin